MKRLQLLLLILLAPGAAWGQIPGNEGAAAPVSFPALPPDPYAQTQPALPAIEEELWHHGGSYLYQPEGDRLNWPGECAETPYDLLRLPECWQEPRPLTCFADFLGTDAVDVHPHLKWPGPCGYVWDPQFVGYGGYQSFAFALEQNDRRQDAVGSQLIIDLDLALTGTERFHVQFRPLSENGTGGSYYQFSDPEGFVNNTTIAPQRYWFEGEFHSIFGSYLDPFAALDHHFVVGQFPFALHNALLMNDEILGVAVNKNTIYFGPLSNLNVQMFYAFDEVSAFPSDDAQLYGIHVTADHRRVFYETTYAYVQHDWDTQRDAQYAAISRTTLVGAYTFAGRAMFKWGDEGGRGSGELAVLETNYTRIFDSQPAGVEYGVFYANAFLATEGWTPIAGSNFNRLRTAFETNPLIRIAANVQPADTAGIALGVQLFRCHEDESWIPELAYESRDGEPVWGYGLRYLRKVGPRSYVEVLGVHNFSDDPRFEREGIFASHNVIF